MPKLQELYILALELELSGECVIHVYADIKLLEEVLEIDNLQYKLQTVAYIVISIKVFIAIQSTYHLKRNKTMTKFIIAASIAAIFGLNALLPADCMTDNGKSIDHCEIINGKEVINNPH